MKISHILCKSNTNLKSVAQLGVEAAASVKCGGKVGLHGVCLVAESVICQLFMYLFSGFNHYLVNSQQCLLSVFIIGNTHYSKISGLVQMRAPAHFYQLGTFSTLIVITSQVQI